MDETLTEAVGKIDFTSLFAEWQELYIFIDAKATSESTGTVVLYPYNSYFCDIYPGAKEVGIYTRIAKIDDDYVYYELSFNNTVYKPNSPKSAIVPKVGASASFYITRSNFEAGTVVKVWKR